MATTPPGVRRMGRARKIVGSKTYSERLARRVRLLREERGLSVDELAAKVGVSAKTIYSWESWEREVAIDKLPLLAKSLGCATVCDLMPPR